MLKKDHVVHTRCNAAVITRIPKANLTYKKQLLYKSQIQKG